MESSERMSASECLQHPWLSGADIYIGATVIIINICCCTDYVKMMMMIIIIITGEDDDDDNSDCLVQSVQLGRV